MFYEIWLNKTRVSNRIKRFLFDNFSNFEDIYKYVFEKNIHLFEDDSKIKYYFKKSYDKNEIENIIYFNNKNNIKICSYYDEIYPKVLKNYEDCPTVFYYKGNIENLNKNKSVSIVGARKCSNYGKTVSELISKRLSLNSINIVSGLAKGIDFYAHSASIKSNGYTAAVIGCGIDKVYPAQNKELYNKIEEKGAIISEFPLGTKPFSYNFPIRNKVISALSTLIIVIEAGERSGALITASCALEQGKDVMAVPGSIFSSESIGTNKLIKDGAIPLTNVSDVFYTLNIEEKYLNIQKKEVCSMNLLEKKVYNVINVNPVHIDEIFRITHIDIKQLYGLLFELQLKNEILCLAGNYYARIVK